MFAKKNLIAVAALATLAVSAQAQSSVTLYGNLDVGLTNVKQKQSISNANESTTGVDSSILTESFFGLKGQEDLGNGLKAIFKLEAPIAVDTGAADSNLFSKNAYVGLAGGFGTVTLGNQESLFKTEGNAFNSFGASPLLAPTSALFTGDSLGGSWQNTIGYVSPNLNGLTLSAQHSAKESAKGTAATYNGGATAVAANYAAGALGLSAVYGDVRTTQGTTADDTRERAFLLGASYDFGVVKAFAQYGQNKFEKKTVAGSEKAKFFQLGAVVPVTQSGAVHAAYGQTKVDSNKARLFSLAYHHTLSKRTSAYAGLVYGKDELSDNVNAPFVVADRGDAAIKTTGVVVGVRHAF